MAFSSSSVGYVFWGLSCFLALCFLVVFDGYIHRNINLVSKLFCTYLSLHTLASISVIIGNEQQSQTWKDLQSILFGISALIYAALAVIFTLVARNTWTENKKYIAIFIALFIFLLFLIVFAVAHSAINVVLFIMYLLFASLAYISMWMLFFKYGNESKHIKLLFIFGLLAGTMGMIDFIFPALVFMGIASGDYVTLWTRTADAVFYVPFIIPLIRYLDTMQDFSHLHIFGGSSEKEVEQLYMAQSNIMVVDDGNV